MAYARATGAKAFSARETSDEWDYWSMKDSVLFCFTVITTIGYGNVGSELPHMIRSESQSH